MRVTTRIVIDAATGAVLEHVWYEHFGPVDLCKKGREEAKAITQQQLEQAKIEAANRARELGAADVGISSLEATSAPGALSPYAAAQLASNMDNIARTYGAMRQTAARSSLNRGFARAPSGFDTVARNALNVGQEQSGTEAYRKALADTLAQKEFAIGQRGGLAGQAGSQETGAAGTTLQGAQTMHSLGSTFGDIMGGIGSLAGIAAAPFTGGLSRPCLRNLVATSPVVLAPQP